MDLQEGPLAHRPKPAKKQKKTIKEIRHRATQSKGYIVEHHHFAPEHPMEEHSVPDQDALMEHMQANQPQAAPQMQEPAE